MATTTHFIAIAVPTRNYLMEIESALEAIKGLPYADLSVLEVRYYPVVQATYFLVASPDFAHLAGSHATTSFFGLEAAGIYYRLGHAQATVGKFLVKAWNIEGDFKDLEQALRQAEKEQMPAPDLTKTSVLEARMVSGPLEGKTLRQAFYILMADLWVEDECFRGKRPGPFDSDWTLHFIEAVISAGLVPRTNEGEKEAAQLILKGLNEEASKSPPSIK